MTTESDLLGTWDLVEFVILIDGEIRSHPFGSNPEGQIMYGADHRVSAILMERDRPWIDGSIYTFDASIEECGKAAKKFTAYGGRFELLEEVVVHHVHLSLYPEMVGTDLTRTIEWRDDLLVLETDHERTKSGKTMWQRLSWRRPAI